MWSYKLSSNNKKNEKSLKRPILYNLGRLISYSFIGGIVGLIGNVISINKYVTGIITILAAFIMLLMSLKMLNIINIKLPRIIKISNTSTSPFITGLVNGLMPCGPLQAMQIYALSTGSFFKGAISMFLFCAGTIPLMLSFGIILKLVKGKKRIIFNNIACILIFIFSLSMLNRGLLTLDIDLFKNIKTNQNYLESTIIDDHQIIEFDLTYDNYQDILLKEDIPTRIIINVDKKYLTGCNNSIIIPEYNIKQELKEGKNIIEFTPINTGVYTYSCWMNMINNNIKVIENK
ncbi:MAG: sulfite exporter TauE/SafE family protein [Candidatus Coprovivens sp.]